MQQTAYFGTPFCFLGSLVFPFDFVCRSSGPGRPVGETRLACRYAVDMRILYIDIDSQRPDHLGCYGYHRNTSPTIDTIAREGVRFDRCYTPDAPCLPSRTAMYSGRFGIQTGVVGHGGSAAQPKVEGPGRGFSDLFGSQGLARKLQGLGYHVAMISPFGQRHAAHWFYAGFNEIHNTGRNGMESAEHVMPVVNDWLGRNVSRDNWYMHINFWDPHTPYRAPMSYGNPFATDPPPAWFNQTVIDRHKKKTGPHSAQDLWMYTDEEPGWWKKWNIDRQPGRIDDMADLKRNIDGYNTGTRYVDDQIATIVEHLKRAGVYDETAIIISADHGENQGDLGIYGEHGTADNATCRIPMIIKWPGMKQGVSSDRPIYNLDLAPTLMELLNGSPADIWDGQSFASDLIGTPTPSRGELILSQCCHVCQRSVRWDRWIYIRTYHDGFHCFPNEMVFDLIDDPFEQNDLSTSRRDLCLEGASRLQQWHDQQMQKMARTSSDVVDPLWTVIQEGGPMHAKHTGTDSPLPGYLKRLEATGRSDGAAYLRNRYGRWLASK
jgi:choline-sulfatase